MSLDETDPSYNAINLIINAVRNYELADAAATSPADATASPDAASPADATASPDAASPAGATASPAGATASPADNIDEEENNKLDWGDTSKYCSGGK